MEQRDRWASKIGLILAMAGNAIGLGNFWRFPYQAAKNGGGAFMIPYFAALFLLGIPIMWVEWVQGRYGGKYGHGTLGPTFYLMSRESLKPRTALIFGIIGGMLAFSVTTLLNSYYLHVIGWSAAYTYFSATGAYFGDINTAEFMIKYLTNTQQVLIFWGISVILLGIAVGQGVSKGIERWVKVMMPVLYIAAILLVLRSLTLGSPVKPEWSSIKGFEFLWEPRFSEVTWQSALAAAGQIFFTLSLGMGIIQNYASYLGPEDDVALSGLATVSLNEFAEVILGGSIAIPIAFAYLGEEGVAGGVGLAYIALPNVFRTMPAGQLFGAVWFLLLWFAGFTSAIAMYNYLVALLEEDLKISRKTGAAFVFILYLILGLPVALDPTVGSLDLYYLTELDNWVGSYLLVVLGLFDIIVAVWLFKPENFWEELHKGAYIKVPEWVMFFIKYIAPIYTLILLVFTTKTYVESGYFKAVPSYVAKPEFANWVWLARGMMLVILIIGAIEAYMAIKKKYAEELAKNEVIIKL